jgi:hypothetical protein
MCPCQHPSCNSTVDWRPGEIFVLKWANLAPPYAQIRQRVYRGDVDSPKSPKSIRQAALGESLLSEILQWRALSVNTAPNTLGVSLRARERPVRPEKVWHRHIGTNLKADGPEWLSFQVLARSGRRCKGGCGPAGTNVGRQPEREYLCGIRQPGRSRKPARFSVSGVRMKHFAVAGPGRVRK